MRATMGFLPLAFEALVEVAQDWVVSSGGESGHEEGLFDLGSTAAGSAIGVLGATLPWMGSKAGEGGGLASPEGPEFGHEGGELGGDGGSDAGDGAQDGDGLA